MASIRRRHGTIIFHWRPELDFKEKNEKCM